MIGIGPKDKWRHDLEKMSRAALVEVIDELHWRIVLYRGEFGRDAMTEILSKCKNDGRWHNQAAQHARFMADPHKAIASTIRRQKAAKAAARRRKKAANLAKLKEQA